MGGLLVLGVDEVSVAAVAVRASDMRSGAVCFGAAVEDR